MATRTTWLMYTREISAAIAEIASTRRGRATVQLSSMLFVASIDQAYDLTRLTKSSPEIPSPEMLDETSRLMLEAWRVVEERALVNTAVNRSISIEMSGSIAVALVMDQDAHVETLAAVLAGGHSLSVSEDSANILLIFRRFLLTGNSGVNPELRPPVIPPQTNAVSNRVPSTLITAWPSVTTFNNKLFCIYQGLHANAQRLFFNVYDGSTWTGATQIENVITSEGPASVVFNDRLYCFKQGHGSRNEIWYTSYDGSQWDADTQVPNTRITGGPSVVVFDGKLYCFHQGTSSPNPNTLWYNVFDGSNWEGDKMVEGSLISASPSAVVFDGRIYCFYQGARDSESVLMMNVLDPTTGEWGGSQEVPNAKRMSEGPSATVFMNNKLFCFHKGEDGGSLYVNATRDGTEWGEDTLIEDVDLHMGPSATAFNGELFYFYQRGENGNVSQGELWYRNLILQDEESLTLESEKRTYTWRGTVGDPSLEELGHAEGYEGYKSLALDMARTYLAPHGYVVYATRNPLLYTAYADETRMCMQYPIVADIVEAFAQLFGAQGAYDQRVLTAAQQRQFPPQRLQASESEPIFTFAMVNDWTQVMENATMLVTHRGQDTTRSTNLWIHFFDKRISRWVEIKGPTMGASTSSAAPVPHFGPSSRLFVLYSVTVNNGEMRYNILDGMAWDGERVASGISISGSPSPLYIGDRMHVFHEGPRNNGRLTYTHLNVNTNVWDEARFAYTIYAGAAPSAVLYKDEIYCFHQGRTGVQLRKLEYSIWNKETMAWRDSTVKAESTHRITGEPTAVVYKDSIYCFYEGAASNGSLWYNVFNGNSWEGSQQVSMKYAGVLLRDGLSAVVRDDRIHVFFRGRAARPRQLLIHKVLNLSTRSWDDEEVLPTASGMSSKPGATPKEFLFSSLV